MKTTKILAAAAVMTAAFHLSAAGSFDIESYVPLKGPVKSYTRTDYDITTKFGDYFRTPVVKMVHTLDGGQELATSETTARDVLVNRVVNVYDSNGRLSAQTGYNADNATIWKNETTYGADGNKADVSEFGKDGTLKSKTIFAYTDGHLTEETCYNGDGALVWKTIRDYNGAGLLAAEKFYYADGSMEEEHDYAYNPDGKIDVISYRNEFGIVLNSDNFRYGDEGELVEITATAANGKTTRRTLLKYDTSGNLSRVSVYTVSKKFGQVMTELCAMFERTYQY